MAIRRKYRWIATPGDRARNDKLEVEAAKAACGLSEFNAYGYALSPSVGATLVVVALPEFHLSR